MLFDIDVEFRYKFSISIQNPVHRDRSNKAAHINLANMQIFDWVMLWSVNQQEALEAWCSGITVK